MFISTISKLSKRPHYFKEWFQMVQSFLISALTIVKCLPFHRATLCCFWPELFKVWVPPAHLWLVSLHPPPPFILAQQFTKDTTTCAYEPLVMLGNGSLIPMPT